MIKKYRFAHFAQVSPVTNAVFHILLIALSLMCVIPLLLTVAISFSPESALYEHGYQLIPQTFSLEGYAYLFKQKTMILRALGMSVLVTALGTVVGVFLTSTMGYVISRFEFKLRKFLMWLVFVPMVFNGGLVSTYFITSEFLGLKNSIWAMILPLAVSSFNVIVCRTFFRTTIPDSIIESARLDGASQFSVFFRIVLPLSKPVLATIALFLSFGYWNDWFQAMLYIDDSRLFTLQAFLNRLLSDINALSLNAQSMGLTQAQLLANMPKEAARMAIVVIVVLPIACAYPFFQRYFISGLTVGAVKE